MNIKELICKKKVQQLTKSDFESLVLAISSEEVSDRQILEFVKIIQTYKLSDAEVYDFASAIALNGKQYQISKTVGYCVDKHSVGSVSDPATIIVASALSALSVKFVKCVSSVYDSYGSLLGRLNSISGFNCMITESELIKKINKCLVGIIDSKGQIAPVADKLYKVCKQHDMLIEPIVSTTIIASKIAMGASMCIVDIKSGEGAVTSAEDALVLADRLKAVGELAGIDFVSIITDLDWPISASVGVNLEMQEIKDTLSSTKEYAGSNILKLAKEMVICVLLKSGKATSRSEASDMFDSVMFSGLVYQKFTQFIDVYGGDITAVSRTQKLIDTAVTFITADSDGFVKDIILSQIYSCTAYLIGKDNDIDMSAGLVLMCGEGDRVVAGQKLAKVFYSHNNPRYFKVSAQLFDCFKISKEKKTTNNLFYKVVV